jgi:hypothetical protein
MLKLEASSVPQVFHVPAPRPWLRPAQDTHLNTLLRNVADSNGGTGDDGRVQQGATAAAAVSAAMSGAVLPALLGGRWLEAPLSTDVTLGAISVLSARLGKGGELEAATARAIYLALALTSSSSSSSSSSSTLRRYEQQENDDGRRLHAKAAEVSGQEQQQEHEEHEDERRALCVALARSMAKELAATEAAATSTKPGGGLRADTQLRLARAIVAQATQATEASAEVDASSADAASTTSEVATLLLLKAPPVATPTQPQRFPLQAVVEDCGLLDAAIAGWLGGWRAGLFSALSWGDRLRLARFALEMGQRER